MIRLDVWLTLPDGSRLRCGELAFGDADHQGRYASAFRYVPDYLSDPRAFVLDPVALPLVEREFTSTQLNPPLQAFEDALPDVWGRRLLVLRHGLKRGRQSEPHLLECLNGGGLGALAFAPPATAPAWIDAAAEGVQVEALADAAARIEAGEPVDATCRLLLAAGSSPGGARPKALVHDAAGHWIAKFPSRPDDCDVVALEAASLALARRAGLVVPDFRLVSLSGARRALLVRRFDRTSEGRLHMLSFRALLQASGYYVLGYADLLAAVRRYGAVPEVDVPLLFRQMAFNALLGNTDDHLKNFWMLRGAQGWRLSPAFDLLPDVAGLREHVLRFDLTPDAPGPDGLTALGRKWGVSGAAAIVDAVKTAVAQFAVVAAETGVPHTDIERFATDIERRLHA
ncbi:MAG: type II toxin-antitoxin system HipA family toxin [Pseudomonadota bacterium]